MSPSSSLNRGEISTITYLIFLFRSAFLAGVLTALRRVYTGILRVLARTVADTPVVRLRNGMEFCIQIGGKTGLINFSYLELEQLGSLLAVTWLINAFEIGFS